MAFHKHIVNVSAMEGQFYRIFKTDRHPHTNMAKASLNMMTRTSAIDYVADGIHMNSVDTGWVTDEDPAHHAEQKREVHRFHPPLDIVDGAEGQRLLSHLREMTARFEDGLGKLGYETIAGAHPIVPLMVRDTERTAALVMHLHDHGVLTTGLNYPVVPRGDEEIRFQISADHTPADIDQALEVVARFKN